MGARCKYEMGEKYGRLTIIGRAKSRNNKQYVLCQCECGNKKEMQYTRIKTGRVYSCGCYNKEVNSKKSKTHGLSKDPVYKIYYCMKQRCYNPKNKNFVEYGGRGIKICDEWLKDFMLFYNWSIKNGYRKGLSIDRIDNNGNYEPSNCRWTDCKTQGSNRRNNVFVKYKGEVLTIAQMARKQNVSYGKFRRWVHENKKGEYELIHSCKATDEACEEFVENERT